jgi:3-oxoacyl-[acyl-carrier protein] reductase
VTGAPEERRALLVTGASGGIGGALARMASADGWRVLAGYRASREAAEALAASLPHAAAVRLPLDDPGGIEEAVRALAGEPVAALALCGAPPPPVKSFAKTGADDLRAQFEAAVVGTHALLRAAWLTWLRRRGGGTAVAVLTEALGPPAAPHMAAYVSAKAGLSGLLEAAAAELGRGGLSVGAVHPGYTETAMLGAFDPLVLDRARAQRPDGRFAGPETAAAALLAILRDPPPPGRVRHVRAEEVPQ